MAVPPVQFNNNIVTSLFSGTATVTVLPYCIPSPENLEFSVDEDSLQ